MTAPVQLTFRSMEPSDAVTAHVERRAAKLSLFYERLVKCHVVVEEPHRHSRHGPRFHVEIQLHVPKKKLVVSKNPVAIQDDLHTTIDAAFDDAERILEGYARRLQVDTKQRSSSPRGVITQIFHERGYGFIRSLSDGHDVYFHKNSLLGERFEKVAVGTKVRFAEEQGDKGPQASSVFVRSEPS